MRLRTRRLRNIKRPPRAIKIPPPKVNTDGLHMAYAWHRADAQLGLRLALEWYDSNLSKLLLAQPLTEETRRTYDRAAKSKALGGSSTELPEKETAWSTAIRLYEKVWSTRFRLPILAVEATKVSGSRTRQVAAAAGVLERLNAAYGSDSFRFIPITADSRRVNLQEGSIGIPISELVSMAGLPPLQAILRETVTVAQATAIGVNEVGETVVDLPRAFAQLPSLLEQIANWAAAQGPRELFKGLAIPQPRLAVRTAAGPAERMLSGRTGWTAGGRYKPGSAIGAYWKLMRSRLGDTLTVTDFRTVADVKSPTSRVSCLAKVGRETGMWTIVYTRYTARMTECSIAL